MQVRRGGSAKLVEGGEGHGAVGGKEDGGAGGQRIEMLADRPGVAAQQGAGERCEAAMEAVLERRAAERSEQRRRFFDAGVRPRVPGTGEQRHEVVGRIDRTNLEEGKRWSG